MANTDGDTLTALEARLARLEAERDIATLLYRWCHTLDHGQSDEWVDCFTEDATFDVRMGQGAAPRVMVGREALVEFASGLASGRRAFSMHFNGEPIITVDGDQARVVSFLTRLDEGQDGGGPYIGSLGRYHDRVVRGKDGRWRFGERIVELEASRRQG